MSKEIKIEQDPDCNSFQCTSEVKLETDVIKFEVDIDSGCEENVEFRQIKSVFQHVQSGQFKRFHNVEEGIDEVVDVKPKIIASMNPIVVLTRLTEYQIKANDIFKSKKDKRNGDSLYRCDVCERNFHQKKTLTRHLYTHCEIKPYICNVCNKDFKYPSMLGEHKLIHNKELKPHVCSVCDRGISRTSGLRKHEFTHTEEKLFTCDFCKKRFCQKRAQIDEIEPQPSTSRAEHIRGRGHGRGRGCCSTEKSLPPSPDRDPCPLLEPGPVEIQPEHEPEPQRHIGPQPNIELEQEVVDYPNMGTPEADTVANSPYSSPSRLSTALNLEWALRRPKKMQYYSSSSSE